MAKLRTLKSNLHALRVQLAGLLEFFEAAQALSKS